MLRVVKTLSDDVYRTSFGGKPGGKFLVSRDGLKDLLGVNRLTTSILEDLTNECLQHEMAIIDLDDCFAFVDEGFVRNFRKVPNSLIREIVEDIEK